MLLVLRNERVPRRLLAFVFGHGRTHDHRYFLLRPRLRLVIVRNTGTRTVNLLERRPAGMTTEASRPSASSLVASGQTCTACSARSRASISMPLDVVVAS